MQPARLMEADCHWLHHSVIEPFFWSKGIEGDVCAGLEIRRKRRQLFVADHSAKGHQRVIQIAGDEWNAVVSLQYTEAAGKEMLWLAHVQHSSLSSTCRLRSVSSLGDCLSLTAGELTPS